MTHTWKIVLKLLRILAGSMLVLFGIVGLAAPILPGWLFIIPGVLLLAKDVPPLRRLVYRLLNSRLVQRLEKRFPRTHNPLQRLRDSLKPRPRRRRGREDLCAPVEPPQEQRDVAQATDPPAGAPSSPFL